MKRETLAELVARTVIEFEKREAELQQQASQEQEQNQEQKEDKPKRRPKCRKSKAA